MTPIERNGMITFLEAKHPVLFNVTVIVPAGQAYFCDPSKTGITSAPVFIAVHDLETAVRVQEIVEEYYQERFRFPLSPEPSVTAVLRNTFDEIQKRRQR